MNVPVLRRTKADWLAVGAITAIAAVALGFSVATSDISHASLQRENTLVLSIRQAIWKQRRKP